MFEFIGKGFRYVVIAFITCEILGYAGGLIAACAVQSYHWFIK